VQPFYDWKKYCFDISPQEQQDLNRALRCLAKRDIDEGGSRFRLRESFISQELGNRDDEDSLFHKAFKLGWLNYVGIAAESDTEEKVYAFFHPTFEEYFAALAIDDWHFFLNPFRATPITLMLITAYLSRSGKR
jgi:predicted NACHT family NTPase